MSVQWLHANTDGRKAVKVPFNAEFNHELKQSVPSARFNQRGKREWSFDSAELPKVELLLEKYYLTVQLMRVEWNGLHDSGVTIDGVDLLSVSRDWWGWRRDCPVGFRVVEASLESGGSRQYPNVSGDLVLDITCRPDAVFEPEPTSVTVLDEPIDERQRPNPLLAYDDEALLAELARRGHRVDLDSAEAALALDAFLDAYDGKDTAKMREALDVAQQLRGKGESKA